VTALSSLFGAWVDSGLFPDDADLLELESYLRTLVDEGMFPLRALEEIEGTDQYLGIPVNQDTKRAVTEKIEYVTNNRSTELSCQDYERFIERVPTGILGNAAWRGLIAASVDALERPSEIPDLIAKAKVLERAIEQKAALSFENKLWITRALVAGATFLALLVLYPFTLVDGRLGPWRWIKLFLITVGLIVGFGFVFQEWSNRPTLSPTEKSLLERTRRIIRSNRETYAGGAEQAEEKK
jgi:hypothetical protein